MPDPVYQISAPLFPPAGGERGRGEFVGLREELPSVIPLGTPCKAKLVPCSFHSQGLFVFYHFHKLRL